jgi:arylsulfatase
MHPLRTGDPAATPEVHRTAARHPGAVNFDRFGYDTAEFGKNHLGDHTDALPTAHGFQEFWGYLYHLMNGVSFPDINKTPPTGRRAAGKNTGPGLPEVPGGGSKPQSA